MPTVRSRANDTIPSEFNSGAEALVRLGYTVCLFTAASVMPLLFIGLVLRRADLVLGGMAAMGVAWTGRNALRRWGPAAEPDVLLARDGLGVDAADTSGEVEALIALLRQWDAMERKRGTPAFEPWALQAWRREIHEAVDRSPALQRLLRENSPFRGPRR